MEQKNNSGTLVGILIGIIIMLVVVGGLFVTGTIGFKINTNTDNGQTSESDKMDATTNNNDSGEQNTLKYKDQSFIGYYQILNHDYFTESKYVPGKYTSFDLEIKLSEDGTALVAYNIDDQGHITEHQYDATYELIKNLDEQIDGDYYKVLKITFTSEEAKSDSNISFLENTTYNPATNPTDGSQAFPKLLVFKHGADSIMPRMITESDVKLLK